jgi:hypothetical protein
MRACRSNLLPFDCLPQIFCMRYALLCHFSWPFFNASPFALRFSRLSYRVVSSYRFESILWLCVSRHLGLDYFRFLSCFLALDHLNAMCFRSRLEMISLALLLPEFDSSSWSDQTSKTRVRSSWPFREWTRHVGSFCIKSLVLSDLLLDRPFHWWIFCS